MANNSIDIAIDHAQKAIAALESEMVDYHSWGITIPDELKSANDALETAIDNLQSIKSNHYINELYWRDKRRKNS